MVAFGCLMRCKQAPRTAHRRCAGECWSPCRRRCRTSRWPTDWGTPPAAPPAPACARRSWGGTRPSPLRGPREVGGGRRDARFRVALGGRVIAVDVAEVALPVDQRVAHGEVLGQARQRVVDRLVAVRVIVAHRVADDLGALQKAAVRRQPQLVHGVKDAPVHGLQAVAHVGQRAVHDGRQRVGEVALFQRIPEVDRLDAVRGRAELVCRSCGWASAARRHRQDPGCGYSCRPSTFETAPITPACPAPCWPSGTSSRRGLGGKAVGGRRPVTIRSGKNKWLVYADGGWATAKVSLNAISGPPGAGVVETPIAATTAGPSAAAFPT